jgi:hypothetical protein
LVGEPGVGGKPAEIVFTLANPLERRATAQ